MNNILAFAPDLPISQAVGKHLMSVLDLSDDCGNEEADSYTGLGVAAASPTCSREPNGGWELPLASSSPPEAAALGLWLQHCRSLSITVRAWLAGAPGSRRQLRTCRANNGMS